MSDDFAADLVVEPSYLYSSSKVRMTFYYLKKKKKKKKKREFRFSRLRLDPFEKCGIALVPLFCASNGQSGTELHWKIDRSLTMTFSLDPDDPNGQACKFS